MVHLDNGEALGAAASSVVAVFAFRDARGRPMAVPVTPYVLEGQVVITSTLAYTRKAQLVRADGRVALLAGGVHMLGHADVRADVSGDFFVKHLLDKEVAKYPPARALVAVPFHRRVFSWYFGRTLMFVAPERVESRPGSDTNTLVSLDAAGFPSIVPLDLPDEPFDEIVVPSSSVAHDGPAVVLMHRESADLSDLRHATMRGKLADGTFTVHRQIGSLERPEGDNELERRRNARAARKLMASWPQP